MTPEEFILSISQKYYKPLYQYIKQVCPDKNLAYDIVQDTFLLAYEKAEELYEHTQIQHWLYRTARYRMLHHLEDALSYEELDVLANTLEDGRDYEEEIISRLDFYPELAKNLTFYELHLLMKHYEDGYPCAEIAEEQHTSKASIKMRLLRIRRKLREGFPQGYS